jgi:hypothetical protein
MGLADHVTINFNNNMSMVAVFLDIEKVLDTIWHPDLYQFSKLHFLASIVSFICSFLFSRKFRVTVEGEMSTPPGKHKP